MRNVSAPMIRFNVALPPYMIMMLLLQVGKTLHMMQASCWMLTQLGP